MPNEKGKESAQQPYLKGRMAITLSRGGEKRSLIRKIWKELNAIEDGAHGLTGRGRDAGEENIMRG